MPNNFGNFNRFLKPDYKPSYNGFGLDKRSVFSIKAGMLNLAYYLHCCQGDHHEIEPVSMIQTDGFNQANFTRMSQHIDYFFVPYTCIKSQFNEWFQQTTDPINSIFQDASIDSEDFVPHCNLSELLCSILYAHCLHRGNRNFEEFLQADTTMRYIGINFLNSLDSRYLRYKSIFVDENNSVRNDLFGYPVYLGAVRLLDQAGYGNYLPIIHLPIFDDNPENLKGYLSTGPDSVFIANVTAEAQSFEVDFLSSIDVDVNLLTLAAYQAVCHNYFKNTYYERPDVACYNFDDLIDAGSLSQRNSSYERSNIDLFTINYRPWKKDIFLSALPSPQFGDVSVVTVLSDKLRSINGPVNANTLYGGNMNGNDASIYQSAITNNRPVQIVGSYSVIDQVKANALQLWKQQVGRAGYRSRDRFRATFGREPGFDPQIIPVPIGSVYSQINKDTVIGTSGDQFGDKCATGSSLVQNEKIVFDCPCFGVIVGIMSILPEADYSAFGIDKHHSYFDPFDFPTPQLQDLGLVPMNIKELSVYTSQVYSDNQLTLGYVPEYSQDKTSFDKLHGEFCSMPLIFMREARVSPIGAFSNWVTSRFDLELSIDSVRRFYVDPGVLDPLFMTAADEYQRTDQFKVVFYSQVRSYRPLHVLGLPQF